VCWQIVMRWPGAWPSGPVAGWILAWAGDYANEPHNAELRGRPLAGGASELTALLERMRARSDNAYCDYIGQLRRDECLGWEIKVERGKFGEAEMKAHCAAAEKLGRHRALHEAANMLAEVLRSNAEITGRASGPG